MVRGGKLFTKYVRTLPIYVQNVIETLLKDTGMSKKDIALGMSSRLCDLEDVINSEELVRMMTFTKTSKELIEEQKQDILDVFYKF